MVHPRRAAGRIGIDGSELGNAHDRSSHRRVDHGWFGTDVAFILDAATYLLSAALIASIRVPKRKKRERQKLSLGRVLGITETIEGIRYVKDRPRVLALLLVKPAWGLGGGILTLLAVFGERIFPVGKGAAGGIGVLFAARGIGTAVGPIVARRISGEGEQRMQASIGIAFLIGGVFYIAFGSATSFVFALDRAGNRALRRQHSLGFLHRDTATERCG